MYMDLMGHNIRKRGKQDLGLKEIGRMAVFIVHPDKGAYI